MNNPSASVRVVRVASWVVVSLPLLYFIVVCTMAADRRSALFAPDGHEVSEWNHILRHLCANILRAACWPPLLWMLLVGFAEETRGRVIAQAVLLLGGCCILIAFWDPATKMLFSGSLD